MLAKHKRQVNLTTQNLYYQLSIVGTGTFLVLLVYLSFVKSSTDRYSWYVYERWTSLIEILPALYNLYQKALPSIPSLLLPGLLSLERSIRQSYFIVISYVFRLDKQRNKQI